MQVEPERPLPRAHQGMRRQRAVFGHGFTIGECGRHTPIIPHENGPAAVTSSPAVVTSGPAGV
ncbi:hypothetical protein GCM10010205_25440 [Streptomyces nojiriensis]|nr:hypothetical protein GCM10010205_25440 [Streptomyces nojiriensis]